MICERCFKPSDLGEHGLGLCPFEPRPVLSAAVRQDSIPGGMTIENLAPRPITFYSHSEHKAYLKQHGIREHVRHVGEQGGDRSRHTQRWV